jgi:hypothetical protein
MSASYMAGYGSVLLVMLPAIIMLLVSMRTGNSAERAKRIISFVSLGINLMALLGFLGFLYVRPTFLNLNMLHALPFLTRFVFNPWILHTFLIMVLLILGILHLGFRKALVNEHGFLVITIATLLVTMCMWVLGSTFHYGLVGRLFVGASLSTKMLVPLPSLIIFSLSFLALIGLHFRYIRKCRFLWVLSIILLACGLVPYYFFAWYLPTFPLGS